MKTRTLWIGLVLVTLLSFSVLLFFGKEIYRLKPPVPEKIVSDSGEVLFTAEQIKTVKMSGSQLADNRLEQSGAMAPILPLTGLPTGCTVNHRPFSVSGHRTNSAFLLTKSKRKNR